MTEPLIENMLTILVFIIGLAVGSFLNVCIWRMPRRESIVTPRSHCVSCNKTIPWYDNIPLLSYILLKGRCRFCGKPISFLYFAVELLTGAVFLINFLYFGISVKFAVFTALMAALIVAGFIDLKIQEIPDEITLPGMAIGIVLGLIFPDLMSQEGRLSGLLQSILGAIAGGGLICLLRFFGNIVFKDKIKKLGIEEAMGGGDVKLMAMLGAFLGWRLVILAFFLAPFTGSVVGIAAKLRKKEDIIPYGPHLSLAAVIALLWGERILRWVLGY